MFVWGRVHTRCTFTVEANFHFSSYILVDPLISEHGEINHHSDMHSM